MAEKKNKRHYCAGSVIHKNNTLKVPRNPVMAHHQAQYGRDAENVFQWTIEFDAHHRNGLLAETTRCPHCGRKIKLTTQTPIKFDCNMKSGSTQDDLYCLVVLR